MADTRIPLEALIILQNNLDALPIRSAERRGLVENTASTYGVSVSSIRKALRKHHEPHTVSRADYNQPRVQSEADMRQYCEIIAALKLRTSNKKGRHLSTKECIRLLEEYGIETPNGPAAKSKTFKRVMKYLGVDLRTHMPKDTDGRRTTARSKGKVERPFRTVKDAFETLYHFHEPETLEEANEWLCRYLQRYNNQPHRLEDHSRIG